MKHKKAATVRDNDGIRCEAAAVIGSFSYVGAKYIKCNSIIIYIKRPLTREKAYCLGESAGSDAAVLSRSIL